MKPGKQTFFKLCLAVLLLLWALLGVWSVRGLSPNVDWLFSDYSGYLCKIFIRPQKKSYCGSCGPYCGSDRSGEGSSLMTPWSGPGPARRDGGSP